MFKSNSPVALFVYNRPNHTKKTIEALSANEGASETDLIIFSDGSKSTKCEDQVKLVRDYISEVKGFKSVSVVLREYNIGLANSIISGVTEVLKRCERVIVLEDDLVTAPFFLCYMNEALDLYNDDDRVASIHGYVYPINKPLPQSFFIKGADCWGWATWRRSWANFNPDGNWLLAQLKFQKLTKKFDFDGTYGYTSMLENQIAGNNDSWAIRWYASTFLQNKLTLYPGRSLVQNIGHDASGVHCGSNDSFDVSLSANPIRIGGIPVEDSKVGRKAFVKFFRSQRSWHNPRTVFSDLFRRLTRNL